MALVAVLLVVAALSNVASGDDPCAFVGQKSFSGSVSFSCRGAGPPYSFVGSVLSYSGDTFSVFLFNEANFLAWSADKSSRCLNTDCGAAISGKKWELSYDYYTSDTYYAVIRCENLIAPCGMRYDLAFAVGYQEQRWQAIMSWVYLGVGVLCVVALIVCCVCLCRRSSNRARGGRKRTPTAAVDEVPLSVISTSEADEDADEEAVDDVPATAK